MKKVSTSIAAADPAEQSIEQLQQRYQKLNTQRIQAQTKLDGAVAQLESLRTEAREKFGTDDIAELRAKLHKMTVENELARRTYQAELDGIESDLTDVEKSFEGSDDSSSLEEDCS